jgi:hypothetical protein
VTIPYVGRCLGSDQPPREGTEQSYRGGTTGVCVACSGRFAVEDGRVVAHETAADDEREGLGEEYGGS